MNDWDAFSAALAAALRLVWLVPVLPLFAAVLIALLLLAARGCGDSGERLSAALASGTLLGALVVLAVVDLAALLGVAPGHLVAADWLRIGRVPVRVSFALDAYSLPAATLIALVAWITVRFSTRYLHREAGFSRFFLGLALFAGGMLLIALSGNAVMTFVGWELAGFSSWLLVGYAWERPAATASAQFVFVTNRVGDAGFLLGIGLAVWSAGTLEWAWLAGDGTMATVTARLLAAGFVLAALVKSAQLPFTPWITRALEGPTPSSAIFYGSLMVHAGVYLLCRMQDLLLMVPDLLLVIALIGLSTAFYAALCASVQSDVKSALIYPTLAQVGLMLVFCGLGLFWIAALHAGLHAAWRVVQFLLAPAWLNLARRPARPVPRWLAGRRWLYTAALQRLWIENLVYSLLIRPTLALGRDLQAFDAQFIDPLIGTPVDDSHPSRSVVAGGLPHRPGLAGWALTAVARRLEDVEGQLLMSGDGALERVLRRTAGYAGTVEALLEQPRYLMLMVMATFAVIL
ncbi:proton-conducting transporter membrane subunit [Accumulibacter sp.]|uniref:proton-conducting transporter transmembrane domain-containing protein n=1 Tax=Accumulibacter sp. TaxID=2053492 RepID=UPI0025DCC980|nr:proton-conducting transporter membrane subunit [Accumulibacter sp.]MCM8627264.1 hypothetical protein [Accumulibacter sp.]